jgi:hypothetical protein
MCLVPGMLSREVSRPNEHARRLAGWIRIVLYALLGVAMLRLLSFSLWSFFLDLILALFGLTFLRANFEDPDRVIMLESVLFLELMFLCDSVIGVLTLVSLVTESTLLRIPITQWQQVLGFVVSGCSLAVYLAGLVSIHLLYRALKETTLVTQDEASGLMGGSAGHRLGGAAVGRVAAQPSSEERFPGQGYKLQV